MKTKPYRRRLINGLFLISATFLFFISCNEDEAIQRPNPTIRIVEQSGCVSKDTIIPVGDSIYFAIEAEYNGYNKLVNFIAKKNGYNEVDLGLFAENYSYKVKAQKGLEDIEEWEFIIRDFEGNQSSVGLTIEKDPNVVYGEIDQFPNVKLGAQNNTETGSFFSLTNGNVYTLEQAYNNQELIDLLYFYDNFLDLEENIIASPGANLTDVFPGTYDVTSWDVKNTTRYSRAKLDVTEAEFDYAQNDSILIANSFSFESGGRKTKFLKPGDIYSFVRDGIIGMFKVVSTSGETSGYIIVDIKIQKKDD